MAQNKLYVGNLSYSTTQAELEQLFTQYGELAEVKLITDRDSGRSRGFGFVTFATQQAAETALGMNGQMVDGKRIVVNVAKEKERGRGGAGRRPRGRWQ